MSDAPGCVCVPSFPSSHDKLCQTEAELMTAMTGTRLSGAAESAASWPDRNIQNTLQQILTEFY